MAKAGTRQTNRDNFSAAVVRQVADRAADRCSICKANTVGPSAEFPSSVTRIGVAAHICAAAPGGPRYDPTMTAEQRSSVPDYPHSAWPSHQRRSIRIAVGAEGMNDQGSVLRHRRLISVSNTGSKHSFTRPPPCRLFRQKRGRNRIPALLGNLFPEEVYRRQASAGPYE